MNKRRRLNGTVKNNKMDKTIIVDVFRTFAHPLYHKIVREKKSYKAHDPFGCYVGDKVVIVESKPISRTVRWVVETILVEELRQEDVESVEAMEEAIEEAIEETETVVEEAEEIIEDVVEEAVDEAEDED